VRRSAQELLEFPALVELVAESATCPPGRRALQALAFTTDRQWLEQEYARIAEARRLLAEGGRLDFSGAGEPASWLERLSVAGAVLEPAELQAAAAFIETAAAVHRELQAVAARFPLLAAEAAVLAGPVALAAEIRRVLLPTGELADDASPELKRIRTARAHLRRQIQQQLERRLATITEHGQEHYITLRAGRYVIPVRAALRPQVPGVVHGTSGSGQTVFIEPLETVELNNELVALGEAEAREQARILGGLTDRLRQHRHRLQRMADATGRLDATGARARFAERFDGCLPSFDPEGALQLAGLRHPLLERSLDRRGRKIVPLDLELAREQRILLISGPNAGGKTAALKAVGLAVLAAQSGIPVPARQARLPLVDAVLADIGDEQSLTDDLSTFSAHVLHWKDILTSATADSLVLLDELGTATAPEEGAALAVALLEELRSRGTRTLATTHHDRLKLWAAATPGVANAAMEFDPATLQPTFHLRVGLPGLSCGLAMARQLGLPEAVLARAERELEPAAREAAALLARLWQLREELEGKQQELTAELEQLRQQRATLAADWARREQQRLAALEAAFQQALERWQSEAAGVLSALREPRERHRAARRVEAAVARLRAQAAAEVEALRGGASDEEAPRGAESSGVRGPVSSEALEPGNRVWVRGLSQPVWIRRRRGDELEVQAGPLRLRVASRDVLGPAPEGPTAGPRVQVHRSPGAAEEVSAATDTLEVIGCTVEEACRLADRFLDRAALAGLRRVRIVHGHGTGALRRGLWQFLKEHPLVDAMAAEAPERGGEAVTVVTLRT